MKIIKIGIVGCGAIGSKIAEAVVFDFSSRAKLSSLYDIDLDKAYKLSGVLKIKGIVALSIEDLIAKSNLVVEAASASVSAEITVKAVKLKRDCLIMSVGGLLARGDIFRLAEENGCKIYIPSGAVCCIDGLKAHMLAGIKKVTLTTRKPPQGLKGSSYILKHKINLDSIKEETVIFEGSASDAVLFFPQNINVAATLSLAGIGKDRTMVRIVCSPEYSGNTHEVEIESGAGKIFARCENLPSPDNPKTSYLAILSAIATIKQILASVKIGS